MYSWIFNNVTSFKKNQTRSKLLSHLPEYYAADIIHSVTRGNIIITKHFLLAVDMLSWTQKKKIIAKLKHLPLEQHR